MLKEGNKIENYASEYYYDDRFANFIDDDDYYNDQINFGTVFSSTKKGTNEEGPLLNVYYDSYCYNLCKVFAAHPDVLAECICGYCDCGSNKDVASGADANRQALMTGVNKNLGLRGAQQV